MVSIPFPLLANRTCLIVEDEPLAQEYMYEYASQRAGLRIIGLASTVPEARKLYAGQVPDIIFLDIEMPGESGIDWLKEIVSMSAVTGTGATTEANLQSNTQADSIWGQGDPARAFPLVVLTTAYHDYALLGYELSVVDYLLKPITEERFDHMLIGLSRRLALSTPITESGSGSGLVETNESGLSRPNALWLKTGRSRYQINPDHILYLEAYGDFTNLYSNQDTGTKKILISERLGEIQQFLPGGQFIRISKSVIINRNAIRCVNTHTVDLYIGTRIGIGETYRQSVKSWF